MSRFFSFFQTLSGTFTTRSTKRFMLQNLLLLSVPVSAWMFLQTHKTKMISTPEVKIEGTPIYRIVLTGGPCGGKSTALAQLSDYLSQIGFAVYLVPEAATLLFTAGASIGNRTQLLSFQASVIKTQQALEDSFQRLAQVGGKPAVIICDRGCMDTAAYVDQSDFDILLEENGWSVVDLRDKRYDLVIHLVTAAIGAEKYYTTENNATRKESLEQAREVDRAIRQAWIGHDHFVIIDNSSDFNEKINRVKSRISKTIGSPSPAKSIRRFLMTEFPDNLPLPYEEFMVEQTYLITTEDNTEVRVKRKVQHGSPTFQYSIKRMRDDGSFVILERQISGREYVAYLGQEDPQRVKVKKRVRSFHYHDQTFLLNEYLEPAFDDRKGKIVILEREAHGRNQDEVSLPPFLTVVKEVTEIPDYSSYSIAKSRGNVPDSV